MSDLERKPTDPTQGKKEFKLFMPSLVVPYDGAFADTYAEYLDDPQRFISALEHRLSEENPSIANIMQVGYWNIRHLDFANKWLGIYYEVFARSSKKAGLPPLQLTDEVVERYRKLKILSSSNGLVDPENVGRPTLERYDQEAKDRRTRDEAYSPELGMFWRIVDQDIESLGERGATSYEIFGDLLKVQELQAIIQIQHDSYSLTGQDIHGLI